MRIVYSPFIDKETKLTGWHLEGREVVIDAAIGTRPAELRLAEEEARNLKKALEDALFRLATKGHGV